MSRPSEANPAKLTDEIRLAVDEDLKATLTALAVMSSKPLAEYIRTVLSLHCYGHLAFGRQRMAAAESRKE